MSRAFEPEQFGRYFLIDRMAVGGMAEIFRGTSIKDGGFQRLVCIKRILEHLSDDQQFVDMFMNEARITVTLQHPNIVQIYDFDRLDRHHYIAMEYVRGRDLRALLRAITQAGEMLPVDIAAYIAHEAARGLHHAHAKGDIHGNPLNIVHRDVSPANLLVSYEGEVKVADFGIARAESNLGHTKTGTLKGKFEYMSPEQLELLPLDGRSDLFALGVVLYNLLTGRRIFRGSNDLETLENVRNATIDPPSMYNPDVPARMDEIAIKALCRDRDQRYLSGRELASDLADYLYPVPPDDMRESLSAIMDQHFSDEKAEEQAIIEQGTRLAREMWSDADEIDLDDDHDWEQGEITGTATNAMGLAVPRQALPFVGISMVLMVLFWVVGLGFLFRGDPGPDPVQVGAWDRDRFGSVVLTVEPAIEAQLYVDEQPVKSGVNRIEFNTLRTDKSVTLRIDAPGYQPHYITHIQGVPGLRAEYSVALEAETVAVNNDTTAEPTPIVTKKPPALYFAVEPMGTTVTTDGRFLGTTPFTWSTGHPGVTYNLRLQKNGYADLVLQRAFPDSGTQTIRRTLDPDSGTPGTLEVKVNGGSAELYLDDRAMGRHSILKLDEVQPGPRTIRAVRGGLTDERMLKVEPGQVHRVQLTPRSG